jgi:phage terminase large subunit
MIEVKVKKTSKWRQLYAPEPHIRYILLYGPRMGGKSYKASHASVIHMTSWNYYRAYIMRNVLDNVRDSIFQDCSDRIVGLGIPAQIIESNLTIRWGQNEMKGRGFKKSSGNDTAKQKSLAGRNVVIIEEAEEVSKDDFTQLDLSLRTTKGQVIVILVFNPPEKGHWILNDWFDLRPDEEHSDFFHMQPKNRKDTAYIFCNYKDNLEHLDPNVIVRAERLKETDLEYYLHKIVGLVPSGKTGRVFKTYNTISIEEYEQLPYEKRYGMDFGSNDPTTLQEVMVHDKNIYIRSKFYQSGMNFDHIVEKIKDIKQKIIADSQAKQTIDSLNARNCWVTSSKKGADSVVTGIKKISSYNIYICEDSSGTIEEFNNYCWKQDRSGLPTDTPEDKNNHAIDAIRYAIEDIDMALDFEKMVYI